MRRVGLGIAVVTVLLGTAVPAFGASALRVPDARTEAQSSALSFTLRRNLDESHVGRCKRHSARVVVCAAVAKGETDAATKICKLRIRVRAVAHRFYTDDMAAITHHRCRKTAKERLRYVEARAAIQAAADAFATTPTSITSMYRRDALAYFARARWERPALHPNEFAPTESCSVEVVATLADGRVSTATEGFSCY